MTLGDYALEHGIGRRRVRPKGRFLEHLDSLESSLFYQAEVVLLQTGACDTAHAGLDRGSYRFLQFCEEYEKKHIEIMKAQGWIK